LATIEILEGADHSFRGSQYLDRMVELTAEWIAVLTGKGRRLASDSGVYN
jgi:hypothetical protein